MKKPKETQNWQIPELFWADWWRPDRFILEYFMSVVASNFNPPDSR